MPPPLKIFIFFANFVVFGLDFGAKYALTFFLLFISFFNNFLDFFSLSVLSAPLKRWTKRHSQSFLRLVSSCFQIHIIRIHNEGKFHLNHFSSLSFHSFRIFSIQETFLNNTIKKITATGTSKSLI